MNEYNLSISVFALPKDTNSQSSVFGGWILQNADLACLIECKLYRPGRYVTIGIDKMKFVHPVQIGDLVKFYTKVERVGNTSITISTKAIGNSLKGEQDFLVTEGLFTFVKTDECGKPISVI